MLGLIISMSERTTKSLSLAECWMSSDTFAQFARCLMSHGEVLECYTSSDAFERFLKFTAIALIVVSLRRVHAGLPMCQSPVAPLASRTPLLSLFRRGIWPNAGHPRDLR